MNFCPTEPPSRALRRRPRSCHVSGRGRAPSGHVTARSRRGGAGRAGATRLHGAKCQARPRAGERPPATPGASGECGPGPCRGGPGWWGGEGRGFARRRATCPLSAGCVGGEVPPRPCLRRSAGTRSPSASLRAGGGSKPENSSLGSAAGLSSTPLVSVASEGRRSVVEPPLPRLGGDPRRAARPGGAGVGSGGASGG